MCALCSRKNLFRTLIMAHFFPAHRFLVTRRSHVLSHAYAIAPDVELENASRKLCLTSHTIFCFAFTGRRSTESFCEASLLIGMMESHPTSRNQESCVVHHFLLLDFLGWHPSNASDVCSSVPVNKSRKLSGNNCKNKSDV